MRNGLHWIDGLIITAYASGMLALGWYYSRRQQSTDEYFTGGRAMSEKRCQGKRRDKPAWSRERKGDITDSLY